MLGSGGEPGPPAGMQSLPAHLGTPHMGSEGCAKDAEASEDRAGQTDRVTALPTQGHSHHPTSPIPSGSCWVSSSNRTAT